MTTTTTLTLNPIRKCNPKPGFNSAVLAFWAKLERPIDSPQRPPRLYFASAPRRASPSTAASHTLLRPSAGTSADTHCGRAENLPTTVDPVSSGRNRDRFQQPVRRPRSRLSAAAQRERTAPRSAGDMQPPPVKHRHRPLLHR